MQLATLNMQLAVSKHMDKDYFSLNGSYNALSLCVIALSDCRSNQDDLCYLSQTLVQFLS